MTPDQRRSERNPDHVRVVVTDFDIPFTYLMFAAIKLAIAAIPGLLILSGVGFFAFAIFTAILRTILAR